MQVTTIAIVFFGLPTGLLTLGCLVNYLYNDELLCCSLKVPEWLKRYLIKNRLDCQVDDNLEIKV